MGTVLRAIALKKLKLGYPVKLSNTCQRLLNTHVKPRILFSVFCLLEEAECFRVLKWLLSVNQPQLGSMSFTSVIRVGSSSTCCPGCPGYPVKLSNTCQRLLNIHVKPRSLLSVFFFSLRSRMASGPETAAISKSATVRFIIKYVLRLRRWRLLTKTTRVKAFIINIMIN